MWPRCSKKSESFLKRASARVCAGVERSEGEKYAGNGPSGLLPDCARHPARPLERTHHPCPGSVSGQSPLQLHRLPYTHDEHRTRVGGDESIYGVTESIRKPVALAGVECGSHAAADKIAPLRKHGLRTPYRPEFSADPEHRPTTDRTGPDICELGQHRLSICDGFWMPQIIHAPQRPSKENGGRL